MWLNQFDIYNRIIRAYIFTNLAHSNRSTDLIQKIILNKFVLFVQHELLHEYTTDLAITCLELNRIKYNNSFNSVNSHTYLNIWTNTAVIIVGTNMSATQANGKWICLSGRRGKLSLPG